MCGVVLEESVPTIDCDLNPIVNDILEGAVRRPSDHIPKEIEEELLELLEEIFELCGGWDWRGCGGNRGEVERSVHQAVFENQTEGRQVVSREFCETWDWRWRREREELEGEVVSGVRGEGRAEEVDGLTDWSNFSWFLSMKRWPSVSWSECCWWKFPTTCER
jgi:hypothetical protein